MKKITLLLAATLLVVAGCIKKKDLDFSNVTIDNWQPDWALPILSSNLTLANMVHTGTTVTEDAEGMYSLHYSGALFSARASDYIHIPDQNFNSPTITLSPAMNVGSFTGTASTSYNGSFSYTDPSGSQFSHIAAKGGTVVLNLTTTFKQNLSATITFPNIKNGGTALQIPATINYPSTSVSVPVNLAGYTLDLTNGGSATNYIGYTVAFTIAGTGQPLSSADYLSVNVQMQNVEFSYLDGYFGSYNIAIPRDTIHVGVFDNTLDADVFIRNPMIHLNFRNSFGVGINANFDTLYGLTNKDVQVNMSIPPVSVAAAPSLGASAVSNYTLDSSNSTVQYMFNPAPNQVIYGGTMKINPGGGSTTYSFLMDTSTISLVADAELPAWFKINKFALQDTVTLSLPTDTSLLKRAEFKLLMDNSLPVYGRVQLYFADASYNILDSLVQSGDNIIGEAPVDANGHVTGNTQQVTTFIMTHDQYNAMAPNVKWAIIRGSLGSSGTGTVKILSTNSLLVKLAFRFQLDVSSTDL